MSYRRLVSAAAGYLMCAWLFTSGPVAAQGTVVDREGHRWDIGPDGSVQDGDNDTFDGGVVLLVNGARVGQQGVRVPRRIMFRRVMRGLGAGGQARRAGRELTAGPFRMGNIIVTRKILVPNNLACARYLEVFENIGDTTAEVNVSIYTDLGNSAMQTDVPEARHGGVVYGAIAQDPQRCSVGFRFGDDKTDFRAAFSTNNNGDVTITFNQPLKIKPGTRAAILHVVAQRRGLQAASAFAKNLKLKRFLRTLDPADRRALVNVSGAGGLFVLGNIQLFRGEHGDTIVLRTGEKLVGALQAKKLTVDTEFGKMTFPAGDILSIFAETPGSGNVRVILQSGEVLTGKPTPPVFNLKLPDGFSAAVPCPMLSKYGRKLPEPEEQTKEKSSKEKEKSEKAEEKTGTQPAGLRKAEQFIFTDPIFVLRGGDRLVGKPEQTTLTVQTAFGRPTLKIAALKRITFAGQETPTPLFILRDGSSFRGFPTLGKFDVRLRLGGKVTLNIGRLAAIYFTPGEELNAAVAAQKASNGGAPGRPDKTKGSLRLANGDFLTGEIKTLGGKLVLETPFGPERSLPTAQIRKLSFNPRRFRRVKATIWDGSSFPGKLKNAVLPFRTAGGVELDIPCGLIIGFSRPFAEPPAEIKAKVEKLVLQLGDGDPTVRNKAQKKLTKMGPGILAVLAKHLKQEDLEIRTRVRNVFKKLKNEVEENAEEPETETGAMRGTGKAHIFAGLR